MSNSSKPPKPILPIKTKSKWRSPIWWMKELATIVVLFSVITFALDWWQSRDMPKGEVPPVILTTLSGDSVDLIAMSYQDPVILYFWATWCPACQVVTPTVNWLSEYYPVVSIAITSGGNARIAGYLRSHNITFNTVNDEKGFLSQAWGIRATPTIVIINDGEIQHITTGITTPPGLLARLWLS